MRISKSAYMQWEWCPRAFKYLRIDKLPFRPTLPMRLGSSFHSFADDFMTLLRYDEIAEIRNTEVIRDIYQECHDSITTPKAIATYAENFVNFEYERYLQFLKYDDPMLRYKPLYIEEKYVVLDAFRETDVKIDLSGIIDRIDPTNFKDGEVTSIALIEYKTGNLSEPRLKKELPFYQLLTEKVTEYTNKVLPPVSHLVAYSPVLNDSYIQEADSKKVVRVTKRLIKLVTDAEKGYFPHNENLFCSTCVGAEACQDSEISREMIIEMCSEAAYTPRELGAILETRPSTIKAILSDMAMEGLPIKKGIKGNSTYWWYEK